MQAPGVCAITGGICGTGAGGCSCWDTAATTSMHVIVVAGLDRPESPVRAVPCDCRDPVQVSGLFAAADEMGSLIAMVNSAGLAIEVAPFGIRVNRVRPGIIDTEMYATGGEPDCARRLGPQQSSAGPARSRTLHAP
ncbi:hypothetical protein ACFFX1_36965 [Dactylosporangium sucinum]|uniref:SDR family oxidoreductase n=1 Tax=Dactylosporangium sucinum TaxID=1424081 RepID=A0A917TTI5_9ACTN|nr:hypothetical protein [Dactylosporangium sucinum]GGM36619.1 hypothetical protein GCM10007977_042650 [Dactylosporangium sucinum]